MGMGAAMGVIDQIAMKGVFRVKDLNPIASLIWLAIGNKSRIPRTIERNSMVILRTRRLELNVMTLHPEGRALPLRVHNVDRARADVIARMRPPRTAPGR